MSHAWGQTVPSNYGRLPPARQKVFHVEPGSDVIELAAKKAIKEMQARVLREVSEEMGEKLFKNISPAVSDKVMKASIKEVGQGAAPEVLEQAFRKNLKNTAGDLAKEAGQKATRDLAEKGGKNTVEQLPDGAATKLGKRALAVGIPTIGAVAAFNSLLNSDAVDAWVSSSTGMDCDEKAVEAGLEPGTEEYTEDVSTCQQKAAESMAFLGKAVTYGGVGIAALIVVSLLGKIGLFSGSGSSDEE